MGMFERRWLDEHEVQIDELHRALIVVLASIEGAGIPLVENSGALRNFFARVRIPLRLADDPTQRMEQVAQGTTNGARHPNGHALAKAV